MTEDMWCNISILSVFEEQPNLAPRLLQSIQLNNAILRPQAKPEVEVATVLVLDEETDSRTLLKRVVQRMGHKVFAFGNGKEASDWAGGNVPDMAIVTVRKRHEEGFSALGRLREINRDLKALVITDVFSDELSEKWCADDFLVKPLDIEQVEARVRKLLGGEQDRNLNS
jgi:DNA-binding response OmpR family regulator